MNNPPLCKTPLRRAPTAEEIHTARQSRDIFQSVHLHFVSPDQTFCFISVSVFSAILFCYIYSCDKRFLVFCLFSFYALVFLNPPLVRVKSNVTGNDGWSRPMSVCLSFPTRSCSSLLPYEEGSSSRSVI